MCLNCEKERDPDAYRPISPIKWASGTQAQSWPKRIASLKKEARKDEERSGEKKDMSAEERAIKSLVVAAERVAMEEWWI